MHVMPPCFDEFFLFRFFGQPFFFVLPKIFGRAYSKDIIDHEEGVTDTENDTPKDTRNCYKRVTHCQQCWRRCAKLARIDTENMKYESMHQNRAGLDLDI